MILAEALLRSRSHSHSGRTLESVRASIISLFGDAPDCPYSIHNIAIRGSIMDKPVGAWFGPNAAAQVIK